MKKHIASLLTGLVLAGGAFAAANAAPASHSKGRICPQVIGGKCSDRKAKPAPHCKEIRGVGNPCRSRGPF